MPFPVHYLLEWGGDFKSETNEIWSNGIRMAPVPDLDGSALGAPGSDSAEQALTDHYADIVTAFVTGTTGGYADNTRLKYVKFNRIGPDGLRVNQTKTFAKFPADPGVSGAQAAVGPITTAMVVTFRTAAGRGRASRGRVFVPHPGALVAAPAYRYNQTQIQGYANGWSTFLSNLANAPGIDTPQSLVPVVASQLETPGLARPILRVQIGNFPDYMGSRRNRTREVRVTSNDTVNLT